MTRIMHVILSLEIGGMEQVVADLTLTLDSRNFETTVVCLESLGAIARELSAQGVTVVQAPRMAPVFSFLFPWQLMKLMRRFRPHIVHTHSGCWHKTAVAAKLAGAGAVVYTEHGRTFPDSPAVIALDRICANLTDRVVAVSEELQHYMVAEIGIASGKVCRITNGINHERFAGIIPRGNGSTIGIIARLAPVKDVETLLRAVGIAAASRPEVRLLIAGDGPDRTRLEAVADDLGLASRVEFLGFRRDVPAVLELIDIFVLSSLSEGTSVTLLEAMAAGKPVVVTRVGGNPSIVDAPENGLLVPPGDPESLAAAVLMLLEDRDLRLRMGKANRIKVAEKFSVRSMAREYEALYGSLR